MYAYVHDANSWIDVLGLDCGKIKSRIKESNKLVKEAEHTGKSHKGNQQTVINEVLRVFGNE